MRVQILFVMALSMLTSHSADVNAQAPYPSKPLRFVLPYPVGGSYDAIARTIGSRLTERLGQPVVVDNRPGAAGDVGTAIAAQAPADGYNLAMFGNSQTLLPAIDPSLRFTIIKDFRPVRRVATVAQVIAINPTAPAQTLKEFIAMAQAKPGQLNFGSGGAGGVTHLAGELLKSTAGIDIVHVAYKGQVPALLALVQNDVQMLVLNLVSAIPQVSAGRIRPLAVTSLERSEFMRGVPTASESGLPGYESIEWYGVLVPGLTRDDVVAKLQNELTAIMKQREVHEQMTKMGANAFINDDTKSFAAFLKADVDKYRKIVSDARLNLERR